MNAKTALILISVLVLIPLGNAIAHKVIIFAWVEDGMIHTESSFGSKRVAKDCAITVLDESGRVVHKGKTDQKGLYSFKIPDHTGSDLLLTLDAGTGHQAKWTIPENELETGPSDTDISSAMMKKEKLEQSPSAVKIISGIVIIFLLAWAFKRLKRKPS